MIGLLCNVASCMLTSCAAVLDSSRLWKIGRTVLAQGDILSPKEWGTERASCAKDEHSARRTRAEGTAAVIGGAGVTRMLQLEAGYGCHFQTFPKLTAWPAITFGGNMLSP